MKKYKEYIIIIVAFVIFFRGSLSFLMPYQVVTSTLIPPHQNSYDLIHKNQLTDDQQNQLNNFLNISQELFDKRYEDLTIDDDYNWQRISYFVREIHLKEDGLFYEGLSTRPFSGKVQRFDGGAKIKIKKGKLHGKIDYRGNKIDLGQVVVTYKNGIKSGAYKEYFSDGQLKIDTSFKNGLLNKSYKEYFSDGQLKIDTSFKNGLLNKSYKEYFSDGQLKIDTQFKEGILNKFYKQYEKLDDEKQYFLRADFDFSSGGALKLFSRYDDNLLYVGKFTNSKFEKSQEDVSSTEVQSATYDLTPYFTDEEIYYGNRVISNIGLSDLSIGKIHQEKNSIINQSILLFSPTLLADSLKANYIFSDREYNAEQVFKTMYFNNEGKLDGELKKYTVDGILFLEQNFKNGLMNGSSKKFNKKSGELITHYQMNDGYFDGPYVSYANESEYFITILTQNDDSQNVNRLYGSIYDLMANETQSRYHSLTPYPSEAFKESRRVRYEGMCAKTYSQRQCKILSKITEYYVEGFLSYEMIEVVGDDSIKKLHYSKNGQIISEKIYLNGKLISSKEF